MQNLETPDVLSILLMEDDAEQALMITDHLKTGGHSVTVCANGTEALEHLEKVCFDVVIADIFVKGEDSFVPDGGYLLINRIRQRRRAAGRATPANVPIIAVSGGYFFGDVNALTSAETMGANMSLQKPFSLGDLSHSIDVVVVTSATSSESSHSTVN